ncbi:MAG: phosphoglyceromutase, partial [Flammeovirgaceae bacterium]
HGAKMAFADEIWFAFLGPDTGSTGEMKGEQQLYQNQVAKTLATFLNVDYTRNKPIGQVISTAIAK